MKHARSVAFGVDDGVDGGVLDRRPPSAGIVFNCNAVDVVGGGGVVFLVRWLNGLNGLKGVCIL